TSADAGLPQINVAPNQGKFLQLLAKIQGARHILEIGTLGGYSTIWLARARLAGVVELRLGAALDTLQQLVTGKQPPFDFIFIDADKPGYPDYFTWALKLSRRGTCIVADNVIREGAVIDPHHEDARVQGARRFNELVAAEPRVTATAIQTVGSKGYDGFTVALVITDP